MAANLCKCASVRLSRLCAACVQICANVCKWLPKCASPERPRHQRCAGSRAAMHSLKMHPKESSTHWNALECRDTEKRKSKFSTETAPCSITTKKSWISQVLENQMFPGIKLPRSLMATSSMFSWRAAPSSPMTLLRLINAAVIFMDAAGGAGADWVRTSAFESASPTSTWVEPGGTHIWAQCFGFQHHPWVG